MKTRRAVADELQRSLDLVAANTESDWADEALEAIRKVCLKYREFHVDLVWLEGLRSTHNDKALGPVMMRAKRLGYCVKTDRVRPSLRSHLSGKPIWKSLLYRG